MPNARKPGAREGNWLLGTRKVLHHSHRERISCVVLFSLTFLSVFLWGSALLTLKRLDSIMKLDQKSKVTSQRAYAQQVARAGAPPKWHKSQCCCGVKWVCVCNVHEESQSQAKKGRCGASAEVQL